MLAITLLLALTASAPPVAGQEIRLVALGFVGFNVRSAPFNNVAVRRAVAAAIDRVQVAQAVDSEPAPRLVPPGCMGATPTERNPYNPEQAKELLAQAGIRAEDLGEAVQWSTSQRERQVEDMIGSYLRAIGLRVTQRQASSVQALRGIASGF